VGNALAPERLFTLRTISKSPQAEANVKMSIRVSIIEDNQGTRESLKELLGRVSGLSCAGAYGSAEEALGALATQPPDVALVDINLPGLNGVECVARLKRMHPKLQMLILTTYEESDLIFDSLRAGASGYLLKNMRPTEIVQAIEQVHAGGAPMSMHIARKVVSYFQKQPDNRSDVENLTKREKEILSLLAKGFLYKEIADQLSISLSTVRAHLHTIYEKLHVQSRTQAVVKFLDR
jgi:DNA-binding NarL/FixJ family response regulator